MMEYCHRDPKLVTIRVSRAEQLQFNLPESKKKRTTTKWRVIFIAGHKKKATEVVDAPQGNPMWDTEVTLKLKSRSEPVCLLVVDSEEHHVGQVIIPPTQFAPRPTEGDPFATWRMVSDLLEPTKKCSDPTGRLYYWAWADSYHREGTGSSSLKGTSLLSISKQDFRSMFHRHSPGSTAKLSREQETYEEKKKKFGRFKGKTRAGSEIPVSHSMWDISDKPRPSFYGDYLITDISLRDGDESSEGDTGSYVSSSTYQSSQYTRGGSFLSSDGSEATRDGVQQRLSGAGRFLEQLKGKRTQSLAVLNDEMVEESVPSRDSTPPVPSRSNLKKSPAHKPRTESSPLKPVPVQPHGPIFSRLTPDRGATIGGYYVHFEGVGLALSHSDILHIWVNGYALSASCVVFHDCDHLSIRMPQMTGAGECTIELETHSNGRSVCPYLFTYFVDTTLDAVSGDSGSHQLYQSGRESPSRSSLSKSDSGVGTTCGRRATVPLVSSAQPVATHDPWENESTHSRDQWPPHSPESAVPALVWPPTNQSADVNIPRSPDRKSKQNSAWSLSRMLKGSDTKREQFEENDHLRKENEELTAKLAEVQAKISAYKDQITTLKSQLTARESDLQSNADNLCNLRTRLLEDGLIEYLEKN